MNNTENMATCMRCGSLFTSRNVYKLYCSDECKLLAKKDREREAIRKRNEIKRQQKNKPSNMDEIARITKDAWETERLSYGIYVAKHGL